MKELYQQKINDYFVHLADSPEHHELKSMLHQAMLFGGKRIRPMLCLIATKMFDENFEKALPQACALELFHTFSLVHDDIMDEAPKRRGKPSIYFEHGRDKAILAGDVILILAYASLLEGLDFNKYRQTMACFTSTAIKVCEGQMFDMDFEAKNFPSRAAYINMIELKTSVLIGASLKIGAIVGGASELDAERLYKYGVLQGLAFQIQDDILDSFGDPKLVGKRIGGDIVQGKKTLLTILCFEKAGEERQAFEDLFFNEHLEQDEKIEQVLAWYEKLNIKEESINIRNSYIKKAEGLLNELNLQPAKIEELSDLSNWLLNRTH